MVFVGGVMTIMCEVFCFTCGGMLGIFTYSRLEKMLEERNQRIQAEELHAKEDYDCRKSLGALTVEERDQEREERRRRLK